MQFNNSNNVLRKITSNIGISYHRARCMSQSGSSNESCWNGPERRIFSIWFIHAAGNSGIRELSLKQSLNSAD